MVNKKGSTSAAAARSAPGTPFRYEFNASEAAQYLGRNKDFIYRAVEQKRIAHSRAGRELRFSRYDLDRYLHANRVEAIDPHERKATA
jgi:excisionase family DNA binding protein